LVETTIEKRWDSSKKLPIFIFLYYSTIKLFNLFLFSDDSNLFLELNTHGAIHFTDFYRVGKKELSHVSYFTLLFPMSLNPG